MYVIPIAHFPLLSSVLTPFRRRERERSQNHAHQRLSPSEWKTTTTTIITTTKDIFTIIRRPQRGRIGFIGIERVKICDLKVSSPISRLSASVCLSTMFRVFLIAPLSPFLALDAKSSHSEASTSTFHALSENQNFDAAAAVIQRRFRSNVARAADDDCASSISSIGSSSSAPRPQQQQEQQEQQQQQQQDEPRSNNTQHDDRETQHSLQQHINNNNNNMLGSFQAETDLSGEDDNDHEDNGLYHHHHPMTAASARFNDDDSASYDDDTWTNTADSDILFTQRDKLDASNDGLEFTDRGVRVAMLGGRTTSLSSLGRRRNNNNNAPSPAFDFSGSNRSLMGRSRPSSRNSRLSSTSLDANLSHRSLLRSSRNSSRRRVFGRRATNTPPRGEESRDVPQGDDQGKDDDDKENEEKEEEGMMGRFTGALVAIGTVLGGIFLCFQKCCPEDDGVDIQIDPAAYVLLSWPCLLLFLVFS